MLKGRSVLQFLNKAMLEMWPFYDKAACAMIKVGPSLLIRTIGALLIKNTRCTLVLLR